MARVKASGLIFTPHLGATGVAALDIHFEPAMVVSARKLDKLGLDIRSMKVPLERAVRKVMIPSIKKNFAAEGRDPKWDQLADSTVRQRGSAHPILVRSGALRRGATSFSIWTIDREKAFIQDLPGGIWYGKVHQAGATFSTGATAFRQVKVAYLGRSLGQATKDSGTMGEIPPRPFVVLRRMDEIQIQKIFNDWLGERVRAAGLSGGRA